MFRDNGHTQIEYYFDALHLKGKKHTMNLSWTASPDNFYIQGLPAEEQQVDPMPILETPSSCFTPRILTGLLQQRGKWVPDLP